MSDELKILDGFINFATKIYSRSGQGENKNFIFSPLNLSLGLSMILAGSKRSSESEIKHLLDYVHTSANDIHKNNNFLIDKIQNFKSEIDFKFLNKLFIQDSSNPNKEYLDFLNNHYKVCQVESINFSDHAKAAQILNDWVHNELKYDFHKKIVDVLISSDYKMVLVNALYFKGNWFKKFDKYLTKPADFHLMDGSVIKVNMMHLSNRKFKFKSSAAGLDASICEFTFVGQELSMSIILPNEDTTLNVVESQLTPEVLKDALEEYNFAVKVNVRVPKFRIEENSEFSDLLKNLDAPHLFNGFRVDFSGIAPDGQNLYLAKVFNKLVVEIDEEGNEAAAAMGIAATKWSSTSAIGQGAEVFNCNRPFIFIIHDHEYRLPLVIGKVTKPDPL